MSDIDIQLEDVLEERAREMVPESLKDSFEHDFIGLISTTRQQIELKRKHDPNFIESIEREAETALRSWIKETLSVFMYGRYTKLMEELGKTPYSSKKFKLHSRGTLDRFKRIESEGIKIGSKVKDESHKDNIFIVKGITTDCYLNLASEDGNFLNGARSPFFVELINS